jgi:hypothetical protein
MDWIELAYYREHWRAVENTVMTFVFRKRRVISWPDEGPGFLKMGTTSCSLFAW